MLAGDAELTSDSQGSQQDEADAEGNDQMCDCPPVGCSADGTGDRFGSV